MVWIVVAWVASLVVTWVIASHLGAALTYNRSRDEHARKLWLVLNDELRGQGVAIMAIGLKVCGRLPWDRARNGEVCS